MKKLTPEDLGKIREKMKGSTLMREGEGRAKITVHMGTCGIASGARDILKAFLGQVESHSVTDVIITTSGCAGLCKREPMATVQLSGEAPVKYVDLTAEKVSEIFEKHVLGGQAVADHALALGSERLS